MYSKFVAKKIIRFLKDFLVIFGVIFNCCKKKEKKKKKKKNPDFSHFCYHLLSVFNSCICYMLMNHVIFLVSIVMITWILFTLPSSENRHFIVLVNGEILKDLYIIFLKTDFQRYSFWRL